MDDEFWICASAELMQIHADSFAVGFHAERDEAIEQQEYEEHQGQEDSKERGDPDELSQHLPALRSEHPHRSESPQSGNKVNGNSAGRIVDRQGEFKDLNQ